MTRTIDKGLEQFKRSEMAGKMQRLGYVVVGRPLLALSGGAAHATAGTYALGTDGGPVGSDYLAAGNGFANNLGPILTSMLPLLLGMLAVWQGPRIVKSLVKRFSS